MKFPKNSKTLKWLIAFGIAKKVLIVLIITFFYNCGGDTPQTTPPEGQAETDYASVVIPDFNADSAYSFVDKQVAFGARVPNTEAHKRCADYLIEKLKVFTDTVYIQNFNAARFDGVPQSGINIIGSINPQAGTRILLCAHWDSRPFADHDSIPGNQNKPVLGANDGASGVGILLEVARVLKQKQPAVGVDILLLDLEDGGAPESVQNGKEESWCLGSQYWAKNKHLPYYQAKYGILLDMVGAAHATFYKEETSRVFAPTLLDNVWKAAKQKGYEKYFVDQEVSGILDDHLYINRDGHIPMVDIIHMEPGQTNRFFKHWHTTTDDMSNISKETLKVVGNVVLTMVCAEKE